MLLQTFYYVSYILKDFWKNMKKFWVEKDKN